ncbi:MAG: hypothetical protein J1E56_06525 [Ruminococcus sp.]|nr:hypothetical protein [Ruminococcus sp.]
MIHYIAFYVLLPIILSVVYSKTPEKYQLQFSITKGCFYLFNAFLVATLYLFSWDTETGVSGFAVMLAIFEGLPSILKPLFNKK